MRLDIFVPATAFVMLTRSMKRSLHNISVNPSTAISSSNKISVSSTPKPKKQKIIPKATKEQVCPSKEKDSTPILLTDLGKLVQGTLIKRPSATVRSPYVSDVQIISDNTNTTVQAHSPALDVGGLCSPGTTVLMTKRPSGGKTSHSIELLLTAGPTGEDETVLVGAHPRLGEVIAEEVLKRGLLKEQIGFGPATLAVKKKKKGKGSDSYEEDEKDDATILRKQVTYNDSRVDFELTDSRQINEENEEPNTNNSISVRKALIEVKNVVCSDFSPVHAPKKTGPNHCVIIPPELKDVDLNDQDSLTYSRSAIFPWGRVGQQFEGKKVVSERAIKHLRNLADITTTTAQEVECIVLFVINRSDCDGMRACNEACPVFAAELKAANDKGCKVISVRVKWSRDGKAFFDGIVPVTL